jgi:hypothetical protein
MTELQNKRRTQKAKDLFSDIKIMEGKWYARIYAFAARLRRELILPVCKQYGLEFYSDGFTWFFVKGDVDIPFDAGTCKPEGAPRQIFDEANLGPIFTVLEVELFNNKHLGQYVAEVRKDDIK